VVAGPARAAPGATMTETTTAADKLRRLDAEMYTAETLAERLLCSPRHVWRMHDAGDLPAAVRIGRLVRWPRTLIDRWVSDGCPKRRR